MRECDIIIEKAVKEGRDSLLIDEAQEICGLHHIPTPTSLVAVSAEDAVAGAVQIGFPVVLKIISPEIVHKSDVGGVALNVKDAKTLVAEHERLMREVGSKVPSAKIRGVLVEKMMPPSTEVIVGGIRDSQFGPSVMFGFGGVFTEVYDDITFRVAPIDRIDANNMIHELKGSRILEGLRGKTPVDVNSIINILLSVSELMLEHGSISELDLNPVIAYSDGACAVDFRIVVGQAGGM